MKVGLELGAGGVVGRAAGTECVLIQPTADDLAVMGPNLMSTSRRNEVIAVATRTVTEQLRAPEVSGSCSPACRRARRRRSTAPTRGPRGGRSCATLGAHPRPRASADSSPA
jgi:hypothetical protein